MTYEAIHPNGILVLAAHALLAQGRTQGMPRIPSAARYSVSGVEAGQVLVAILSENNGILWEDRGIIMEDSADDGGAVLVFSEGVKKLPTFGTVEEIRAEISRLEADLSCLSGEPLDLEYHDLPEGGAILEYAPAVSEYGFQHWYPTLQAAKAALLKMARDSGTVPDSDGLHADMSPPAAQYSTRAWITRRG